MLSDSDLIKLEWNQLTAKLAGYAQTEEGRAECAALEPYLDQIEVTERWQEVITLRDIARSGYSPPIGDLKSPLKVFKASEKAQILDGLEVRTIYTILQASKNVLTFASSFGPKSPYLQRVRATLYPLPELAKQIEKTIDESGQLKDDASPDLAYLRKLKTNLRNRIEETLERILSNPEISDYLQDMFYTVRNERYVIPIRLDGRGRIKGLIIDTSDSGQTLFLEPASISLMNQELHDLDVAEKLEIIRIFRELSAEIAKQLDVIRHNYSSLIDLDKKSAEAALAVELDAGTAQISAEPCLHLIEARHPLIKTATGQTAVSNTITLQSRDSNNPSVLIVSGPNAGGKTVVLKTVGLMHLMAKAGLLLPLESTSKIFFFEKIFLALGDNQNLAANLSTFSSHLLGLKPILESAGSLDLALLDELATGTEPNAGSAIAQAIIEHLAKKNVTSIVTTHFDTVKTLAIQDQRYRNASMEYSVSDYRPTYKLVLDIPGQSYSLELANQIGIPKEIISRAKSIRGAEQTNLDSAIDALQQSRSELHEIKIKLEAEILGAESAKARWTNECKLLEEQRIKATKSLAAKIENEVDSLRADFEDSSRQLKKVVKDVRSGLAEPDEAYDRKKETADKLRNLEKKVSNIALTAQNQDLPGMPIDMDDVSAGLNVYVLPLKREGVISKVGLSSHDPIEVQVGLIKVRVSLLDLRKTRGPASNPTDSIQGKSHTKRHPKKDEIKTPPFVPQTKSNTLDVRGSGPENAVEQTLNFIDRCLRNAEPVAVIIHGHGSDRLKMAIRSMLKDKCPYDVTFRPGEQNEGGDGVTIVSLE